VDRGEEKDHVFRITAFGFDSCHSCVSSGKGDSSRSTCSVVCDVMKQETMMMMMQTSVVEKKNDGTQGNNVNDQLCVGKNRLCSSLYRERMAYILVNEFGIIQYPSYR